jgi:hypothetical protein
MTKTIELSQGQVTIVDNEDFEALSKLKWYAWWNEDTQSFYAVRNTNPADELPPGRIYMHRIIVRAEANEQTDHRDHDTLNNQRLNLRRCTQSQNRANQRVKSNNTSGFKGVGLDKRRGLWRAYIGIHRRQFFLGYFKQAIDAARTYDAKARELFGEFAFTNF